jgi:cation transport ATPase
MQLKEIVHNLTDLIWQAEQQTEHPLDDAILSYVRDAVAVEVDYRRRMRELDRRLIELETSHAIATPA